MTLVPPRDTSLGYLRIDEVYIAYDGPRFFLASSRSGQKYLSLAVDETQSTEVYLYLPISEDRLALVRSGGYPIRDAFVEPEDGVLWEITADYDIDPPRNHIAPLRGSDIPEERLPEPAIGLEIPTETRQHFSVEALEDEARATNRTVIALEVEPPDQTRTEYPLRSFARIATSLQDVVYALAQEEAGTRTSRGAIQAEVMAEAELVFARNEAASFVFVVASDLKDRMFEGRLVGRSVGRLSTLLEASASPEALTEALSDYGPRARSRFSDLLECLSDDETGATLVTARPEVPTQTVAIGLTEVRSALYTIANTSPDTVHSEIERAILIGVNLRLGTFEIVDAAQGSRYNGRVDAQARAAIAGLPTGDAFFYKAVVVSRVEYSNIGSDEVARSHRLTHIEPRTDI